MGFRFRNQLCYHCLVVRLRKIIDKSRQLQLSIQLRVMQAHHINGFSIVQLHHSFKKTATHLLCSTGEKVTTELRSLVLCFGIALLVKWDEGDQIKMSQLQEVISPVCLQLSSSGKSQTGIPQFYNHIGHFLDN